MSRDFAGIKRKGKRRFTEPAFAANAWESARLDALKIFRFYNINLNSVYILVKNCYIYI